MNAFRIGTCFLGISQAIFAAAIGASQVATAQFDLSRNDLQLVYDLPLISASAQAAVTEGDLTPHEFLRPGQVLLLVSAPVRLEDETRLGQLFFPIPSIDLPHGKYNAVQREDYLNSNQSDELRGDAARKPMQPASLTDVVQAEPLHAQSDFRSQYAESFLLANVRRFEQSRGWQIGGGGLFSFGWNHATRLMVHCGPSFKQPREAFEGEHCFGLLLRFDLGKRKTVH